MTDAPVKATFRDRAATVASLVTKGSLKLLDRTEADFLNMPWPSLDEIVSGMSGGDIWFVGGFSGDGKTTCLTSLLDLWYEQEKRIFYLGLESRPNVLKTHWACKRLNIDSGEVLTGRSLKWRDWPERRDEIKAMVKSFDEGQTAAQVHFSPTQFVDEYVLTEAMGNARDFGADLLIIDHIDHIEGEQGNGFDVSRKVCTTLLKNAQSLNLRCLVATQFNNEAVKGNKIGRYLPPQPHYVYMGGHKRQVASGMLGIYRPLKKNIDPDALKAFQMGGLEPKDICEPDTMGIVCMKHRAIGRYEGRRVYLNVHKGRVREFPEHDHPMNPHGIRTSSGV